MSLHQSAGKFQPALLEDGVVRVVPAVLGIEILRTLLHGPQLHSAERIVQSAEGLAAAVVIESAGGLIKALPCGKVAVLRAGGGGEAVKGGAVEHQHMGGFGHGEYQQLAVRRAVVQKAGNELLALILGKEVVPVHHILCPQRHRIPNVAGEHIRHLRKLGAARLRLQQKRTDLRGAAGSGDGHPHALFRAHRPVELVHKLVHGRAGLLAVDVPEGQRHRVILVQQRFLAAGEGEDHQRRQQRGKKSWFHVLSLQIEQAFDKLPYF